MYGRIRSRNKILSFFYVSFVLCAQIATNITHNNTQHTHNTQIFHQPIKLTSLVWRCRARKRDPTLAKMTHLRHPIGMFTHRQPTPACNGGPLVCRPDLSDHRQEFPLVPSWGGGMPGKYDTKKKLSKPIWFSKTLLHISACGPAMFSFCLFFGFLGQGETPDKNS